jgi:hypothetical protein
MGRLKPAPTFSSWFRFVWRSESMHRFNAAVVTELDDGDRGLGIAKDGIVVDSDELRLSCRTRCKYPGHKYRCDEHPHDITSASLIVSHWRLQLR